MDDLAHLDGMFEGLLSPDELELFERAIKEHRAYREYRGAAGFMGLAKVKLVMVPK